MPCIFKARASFRTVLDISERGLKTDTSYYPKLPVDLRFVGVNLKTSFERSRLNNANCRRVENKQPSKQVFPMYLST